MLTKDSTIQSTISKKDSAVLLVGSFVFGSFLIFRMESTLFSYIAIAGCIFVCVLGALALVVPSRFKRGVRIIDDGFEHMSPLRGSQRMKFDAISRIEALSTGGGDAGDDVPFMVYTDDAKALLLEADLYTTCLFDRLTSLPGFRNDVLQQAFAYEVKGLEILLGRRFSVYEKT